MKTKYKCNVCNKDKDKSEFNLAVDNSPHFICKECEELDLRKVEQEYEKRLLAED